jgi:hypothetical protein
MSIKRNEDFCPVMLLSEFGDVNMASHFIVEQINIECIIYNNM